MSTLPRFEPPRFQALRAILALVLREMGTTYGRSPGGYVWAILQPIGVLAIMSLAFSAVLRSPSLGTSFILFYATGYLPFSGYGEIQGKVSNALRFSKALLAYPRVTWIDTILARLILAVLTKVTVGCIVFAGILALVDTRASLDIGPILNAVALSACIGLGVGMMNCLLNGLVPIWSNIWGILTAPLFLASGVIFLYEDMPQFAQDILWWNPILHAVGVMRRGFYPTYEASYVSLTYGYGLGATLILLALVLLRRHHKRVLEN
ncbi:ABC transporter permease [Limimaricola hongkongensis]|uniref:STRUCTURAL ELEMENTS/ Cell Exterior/ surface polysaccharides/antigen n=1 Tax=Limimaricola hongkongensis DSM 17492 TaxID=1122180 RepID=A0A017H888_9RHOB|nr:ABC transporter permease [Limimaricola hongkongensis]EYD70566.1 STRUCTURAL ELEMENTS/ Cell Exterior/ surface polysaccharides/antigen [Limimaricola hongkongensis DSM 17492]